MHRLNLMFKDEYRFMETEWMLYNYYFDICAICILASITVVFIARRLAPTYQNRMFMLLFLSIVVSCLSERIETLLQLADISAGWYRPLEMAVGSLYFVSHLSIAAAYLAYLLSLININYDLNKYFLFLYGDFWVGVSLIVLNFFTPILFYYDDQGIYHRGSLILVYYLLAALFIAMSIYIMYRFRLIFSKKAMFAVHVYIAMIIIGIVIQYFYPNMLVEQFFNTLSFAIAYLTTQNPTETFDSELPVYSKKALTTFIKNISYRRADSEVVFVVIKNMQEIENETEHEQALELLKNVVNYLSKLSGYYLYRYADNTFALVSKRSKTDTTDLVTKITERFNSPFKAGNMSIRMDEYAFVLKYPADFKTVNDFVTKANAMCSLKGHVGKRYLDTTDPDYGFTLQMRQFEKMARTAIETGSITSSFMPAESCFGQGIAYGEIRLDVVGEDGGHTSGMPFRSDVDTSKLVGEFDEHAMDMACKYLYDSHNMTHIAVPMSLGEISRPDFVKRISNIFENNSAGYDHIYIKISETAFSMLSNQAERNLSKAAGLGCKILIDGFGIGYSDMQRILRAPVAGVCIGYQLIKDARSSTEFKKVARGIVDMMHDIDRFVVAEDIETQADLECAMDIGCNFAIGSYLSDGLVDVEFSQFVREHQ